jgi:hypothetical protein
MDNQLWMWTGSLLNEERGGLGLGLGSAGISRFTMESILCVPSAGGPSVKRLTLLHSALSLPGGTSGLVTQVSLASP